MARSSTRSKADKDNLSHASYWDSRYQSALSTEPATTLLSSNGDTTDDPIGHTATKAPLRSGSGDVHEQPDHEWFRSPDNLIPFLTRHLFETYPLSKRQAPESRPQVQSQPPLSPQTSSPHILHLGPGTSHLPAYLHFPPHSYHHQTAIDFSPTLIHHQRTLNPLYTSLHPPITWIEGDVRDMPQIATGSVNVAIDKGTLDAMIDGADLWDPGEEVRDGVRRYLGEVGRVLREGSSEDDSAGGTGVEGTDAHHPLTHDSETRSSTKPGSMLYITYRQPHFIKPLLALQDWAPVEEIVVEELEGEGGSFGYFGYVLKKKGNHK